MKKNAIIRLIVMLLAIVNGLLTASGHNPIPFDESLLTEWLSYGFDIVVGVWIWYKNAPVTKEALTAQEVLEVMKEYGIAEARKLLAEREV